MSVLAGDIIKQALKTAGVLGVGQTALAEDTSDALTMMNWMLSQWQRKRWLVYHLIDMPLLSNGHNSYTIGPGGDFNIPLRPEKIASAFVRQMVASPSLRADFGLEIIEAREDYNLISLKDYPSFPSSIFYDSAFPLGTVYFTPTPASQMFEIHLAIKDTLPQFTTVNDQIILPSEYFAALQYNLARRLRVNYQLPVDVDLNALARDALNVVRGADLQLATLQMPMDLPGVMPLGLGIGLFGGGSGWTGVSFTENWAGGALVTPGDYVLTGSAPYAFNINNVETSVGSLGGQFNFTLSIDSVPIVSLSNIDVTAVDKTTTPGNGYVGIGSVVTLTINSVVGTPTDSWITVSGNRT